MEELPSPALPLYDTPGEGLFTPNPYAALAEEPLSTLLEAMTLFDYDTLRPFVREQAKPSHQTPPLPEAGVDADTELDISAAFDHADDWVLETTWSQLFNQGGSGRPKAYPNRTATRLLVVSATRTLPGSPPPGQNSYPNHYPGANLAGTRELEFIPHTSLAITNVVDVTPGKYSYKERKCLDYSIDLTMHSEIIIYFT